MVPTLKKSNITQVFNYFAQKKCVLHQKRKASSVCLHEDCWKSQDGAFYCEDCNIDHRDKHGNLVRFNALFTDELLEELDEHSKNLRIPDKLEDRRIKFEQKINYLCNDIEQWTKFQFIELQKLFNNQSRESFQLKDNYIETIENMKEMLSKARLDLSLNYESKEKGKLYCIQIQKIKNDFNEVLSRKVVSEVQNKEDKMDLELNSKFQKLATEIKGFVKNQTDQLGSYLIDYNPKNKLYSSG